MLSSWVDAGTSDITIDARSTLPRGANARLVAASAAICFLGVAVGWWLFIIGAGAAVLAGLVLTILNQVVLQGASADLLGDAGLAGYLGV